MPDDLITTTVIYTRNCSCYLPYNLKKKTTAVRLNLLCSQRIESNLLPPKLLKRAKPTMENLSALLIFTKHCKLSFILQHKIIKIKSTYTPQLVSVNDSECTLPARSRCKTCTIPEKPYGTVQPRFSKASASKNILKS